MSSFSDGSRLGTPGEFPGVAGGLPAGGNVREMADADGGAPGGALFGSVLEEAIAAFLRSLEGNADHGAEADQRTPQGAAPRGSVPDPGAPEPSIVARSVPERDAVVPPAAPEAPTSRPAPESPTAGPAAVVGITPGGPRHPSEVFTEATGLAAAQLVAGMVPGDLDDFTLGEALRTTERLMSWAASIQARVVQEMAARAGSREESVRDDVAALLCLSGRAADVVTDRAHALGALPAVHDALAAGRLDVRRVDTIIRSTGHLTYEGTRDVLEDVLPRAERLTAPELRDAIRTADATRDPAALEKRHSVARADRCVTMTPAPDAMAWVTAYLPADDAMAVWSAIDALAQGPDTRDGRTLDRRRADALTSVMRDVLDRGAHPDGTPLTRAQGRHPHLSVIARPELLLPGAVGTATLEGYGPIPASVARQVAADADWRAIGIDPLTGEAAAVSSRWYRAGSRASARGHGDRANRDDPDDPDDPPDDPSRDPSSESTPPPP